MELGNGNCDSNLYLGRTQDKLRLTIEHRAARAPQPITLTLTGDDATHLVVDSAGPEPQPPGLDDQVVALLGRSPGPLTQYQLRCVLKVRNQSLTAVLQELLAGNRISRYNGGWMLPR